MGDHELGIRLPQEFIGDALARPRAALRRLDEDIGVGDEPADDLLALIAEVVHRNGTLVAALGLLDPFRVAHGVAGAGGLEPDDVGAPVGHEVARARNGFFDGCVHDFHAIKDAERRLLSWKCHGVVSLLV
mgnify:CR=1 FL=1